MSRASTGALRRLPSGRWQARITHLGRQVTIGTFATRRQASEAVATARGNVAQGRFVDPAGSRQRLGDLAESWWPSRSGHRASTQARDRMALDHDILPVLGQARLQELGHPELQAWVNQLGTRLAPSSVRRTFTVLVQILDAAVDAGALATNPARRVRLPRLQAFEARFLDPEELEALAAAIDPRYRAMVLTMAWATLRIGEAAGLRGADVDPLHGTIRVVNNVVELSAHLHEGPPKTRAGRRTMTIPASVMSELVVHLGRHAGRRYVFVDPNRGEPLRAEAWRRKVWDPAIATAGLAPLRPHDLKHTGVALLAAAGVDPGEIARRAGHSSVAFTYDRYGHLFPELDRQAAAKLDTVRSKWSARIERREQQR